LLTFLSNKKLGRVFWDSGDAQVNANVRQCD